MPFAALNQDPAVLRHLPGPLTRAQSDALVDRIERHFAEHGFGPWALELADSGKFAGLVGLKVVSFEAWFTPAVEIAWRLAPFAWGQGYATEAARAVLDAAFGELGLNEVVSFTVPANAPSWRVMERLGMAREGVFDHPELPGGHALRHHVFYRITKPRYLRLAQP